MDSRRAENEDEAERKRQRSVKRPGSHRRSSSLDVRSGINVTGEQGRKSSTHLELPVVTPEQRGRSADGRSGKSRDHLSPGNTSSRRRSSDVRRETSQGRTKYPGVVEDPARNGAHKPKPVVPDQGRAQIESRKNLTRNDLRKAVTSAAEMMGTDPEKSSTAARIILDALLWDSIQKFDRYDDDIVLAKEYLIISYFNTGDFAKAEDLSRQVLAARMAKRPPVAMLVRAARQKLTQVLVKIGTQNRKDGKEQEANQVIDEALDYAVMNVSTRNNPKTRDDAGDVLFCCSELLKHRSNLPKERARLIRFKIMALQKTGNNEGFNSLNRITLERRQLMRTYVLELKDKAQGGKVYDETQRGIEAFQLASRIQSRLATSLSIETEAFWEGLLSDAAKEETDRREVRSRYEGGDTGRSSGDQTTAKGVKHARQKEADLENGNPSDPGVHQGAARTGTGLTDASENEPKFVLFDATPTPTNKLSERWIRNFAKFRRGILPGQFDDKTTERIRLTVIDTGIDASHPFIKEHWNSCRPEANGHKLSLFKDFDSSFDSPVDHDGHGTFIAGLILRLAPDVELSVARVCKNQRSMAEDNCWDEKIARAVYYAGETWKTDIISISLGSFMEATACLRTAIRKVQKSDVVFFCAAGNHGNTRGNLPVPAKLGGVFKIFACDHLGYATTMNPQPTTDKDHCFGILGCDYMSTWPMSLKITGKKPGQDQEMIENPKNELPGLWTVMSGTSFATPVAAALVAIIYQFYNENKSIRFGDVVVDLKTPEAVQAILLRMSLPHGDGYKTLVPTSESNNIQDNDNLEMMVHVEGPIVDSLYDMALLTWHKKLDPPLPTRDTPAALGELGSFGLSHDSIFTPEGTLKGHRVVLDPARIPQRAAAYGPGADQILTPSEANGSNGTTTTIPPTQAPQNGHSVSQTAPASEVVANGSLPEHTHEDPHYDTDIAGEIARVQAAVSAKPNESQMQAISRHLNHTINKDFKGTAPECDPADEMTPYIPHPTHEPFPIALVNRPPYGPPNHKSVGNPQNAAWLSALRNAEKNVFIQTPTLNAEPLVPAMIEACERGVDVFAYVCLGYNDAGELLPMQGGHNEMVAAHMYEKLSPQGRQHLHYFWYIGKDQTQPIIAEKKNRSCHVKLMIVDESIAIVGSGNQDTQSWFHSQEVNIMLESRDVCKVWIDGLRRNQNTHRYGALNREDGVWRDENGKEADGATGVDPGRFSWAKGLVGAIKRLEGTGGF